MAGSWNLNHTYYFGDDTDEDIIGSANDESVQAGAGDDTLRGRGGDDTLDGGLGNDIIHGGRGNDILYDQQYDVFGHSGPIGADSLYGGAGDDILVINSAEAGDFAGGGKGIDLLRIDLGHALSQANGPAVFALSANAQLFIGGVAALTTRNIEQIEIVGTVYDDHFEGGALADSLFGGDGNDTLIGYGGDDVIDMGAGDFSADGGAGIDALGLDFSAATQNLVIRTGPLLTVSTALVSGMAANFEQFIISTGSGDDRLVGGALNDTFDAGDGQDILKGHDGDDKLVLGVGAGIARGGAGNDYITHSNSIADTAEPGDSLYGGAGDDIIEAARHGSHLIKGGGGNDWISADSTQSTNLIYGGAGNDGISSRSADTVFGGAGNDSFNVRAIVEELYGGEGDDYVRTDAYGSTTPFFGTLLDGGAGFDHLRGTILLSEDVDFTSGPTFSYYGTEIRNFEEFFLTLGLAADADVVLGSGDDYIDMDYYSHNRNYSVDVTGGAGHDIIEVYCKSSTVRGGAGDDHLTAIVTDAVKVLGGTGDDFLTCTAVPGAVLNGGAGFDIATVGYATVVDLAGGFALWFGNKLTLKSIEGVIGGWSDDIFLGSARDELFDGGNNGQDTITTGGGHDTIIADERSDALLTVTDFDPALDIIGIDTGTNYYPGPLDPAQFITGSFPTPPPGGLREPTVYYDTATGAVWIDGTSTAPPELELILQGAPVLTAAHFYVDDYFP